MTCDIGKVNWEAVTNQENIILPSGDLLYYRFVMESYHTTNHNNTLGKSNSEIQLYNHSQNQLKEDFHNNFSFNIPCIFLFLHTKSKKQLTNAIINKTHSFPHNKLCIFHLFIPLRLDSNPWPSIQTLIYYLLTQLSVFFIEMTRNDKSAVYENSEGLKGRLQHKIFIILSLFPLIFIKFIFDTDYF